MADYDPTQPMNLSASHLQNLADRMVLRSLKEGHGSDIALSARVLRWLVLAGVKDIILPPLLAEGGPETGTGVPNVSDASQRSG